jgi:hypothetical protein
MHGRRPGGGVLLLSLKVLVALLSAFWWPQTGIDIGAETAN